MSANAKDITTAGSMAASEIPRRAMFTYWGLGVEITGFTPQNTGKNYTLTPSLAPLAPFKDDCTLMTGLSILHRRPWIVLLPADRGQYLPKCQDAHLGRSAACLASR